MKNIIFILLVLTFYSMALPASAKLKKQKTFNEPHQHDLLWSGEERQQSMLANLDRRIDSTPIDWAISNKLSIDRNLLGNYRSTTPQSLQLVEPIAASLQQCKLP